ncbi:carbohydrate ABC transporter permease [Ruminococcaceae bacterium OttesenSCG-928-L11]|nr:carbohydrate ABC transporter permease [Ruminococcaceae bacterium OttesenSCG-928-L11]
MAIRQTKTEKAATGVFYLFIIGLCIITLYPFIYVFCYSISDGAAAAATVITVYPVGPTLENYTAVFNDKNLVNAFIVSVSRTVLGTLCTLFVTMLAAYALSKPNLVAKKFIMWFFMITMYFNAGMLPNFVLMTKLNLLNNFLVYLLPVMFSTYYMIIFKSFFEQIPSSLLESAVLDGASEFVVFTQIVIPSSTAVIATIALFAGVWQWNAYFDGILYVSEPSLQPLQTLMYRILQGEQAFSLSQIAAAEQGARRVTSEGIKMSMLIVSTVPILCVYPFLQKYFVKGIMLGAVKG